MNHQLPPMLFTLGELGRPYKVRGGEVIDQLVPQPEYTMRPLDWRKFLPFEPAASSDRLGWVGLEAASCR
jgi:hypothetical protein